MERSKIVKWLIFSSVIVVLIIVYKKFNPEGNIYFPKCPFKSVSGLECPGCGSQRAIHHLLNLEIALAIRENILLVLSIPYLLIGVIFDSSKNLNNKQIRLRKTLFGQKAVFIVLAIVILFWIVRNFFDNEYFN